MISNKVEKYTYQLFERNTSVKSISNEAIIYSSWFFLIAIFYLTDNYAQYNQLLYWSRLIILIFVLLLSGYWGIVGLWRYQSLCGEFTDELEFGNDYFKINEKVIELVDLKKIDIQAQDYYGKQTRSRGSAFSPGLSQGTHNYICIVDQLGNDTKIFFKQRLKNEFRESRPFIISAIRLEKISLLRGLELLGIHDYEEIQQFKLNLER